MVAYELYLGFWLMIFIQACFVVEDPKKKDGLVSSLMQDKSWEDFKFVYEIFDVYK